MLRDVPRPERALALLVMTTRLRWFVGFSINNTYSKSVNDPGTQQVQAGMTAHRLLDHLQSVHLALHGSIAPWLLQARLDRCLVLAIPSCEATHFLRRCPSRFRQPICQSRSRTLTHHRYEFIPQPQNLRYFCVHAADPLEPLLLGRLAILGLADVLEG